LAHPSGTIKRVFLLAASVVFIRLPTLWEPRWYSDEGTFTTAAWVHSLGVPLYSGVFDINPPGIYWLYGALLRMGAAQHHVVVQTALLLAVLVSVLCLFGIASTWFGSNIAMGAALLAAVGLSLPTLDGDLLNIEMAALPFFLAGLLMAVQKGNVAALFAGIFTGCALLIRPSYTLESFAVLVVLLTGAQSIRRIMFAVVGGLAVLAAALITMAADNSLLPYVSQVMPVQRAYVIWANGGSLAPLGLRFVIALLIVILWFHSVRRVRWRPLAIWLPASLVAGSITPRELSHYAVEVIPPVAIGISLLIAVTLRGLPGYNRRLRLASLAVAIPLGVALLVLAAEASLILPAREVAALRGTPAPPPFLHNFSYASLPGYYARWAGWVVLHPFQAQDPGGFPGPFREEEAEARLLDQLAGGSTSKIQVLGDRSWVYFLGRLRPATPYVAMNSAFRLVDGGDAAVQDALRNQNADFVALADVPPADWLQLLQSSGYQQIASIPWKTYHH
jgi:hypothetical protein